MKRPTIRAAVAALLCTLVTACSLFHSTKHEAPPPPPAPPPAPVLPDPVAAQRFELTPDDDVVGVVQIVKTSKEDTLTDIARRFNVGYEEILRANPKVDPWLPGADRPIVVPTQFILPNAPRTGVVINIAAMRLFYYPPHKKGEPQVVITHPIGIGKVGWSTPEGVTKIVRRQADPTWRVPVSVIKEHRENGEELEKVIGPGPDNPLGKFAFYLQWPSYLIHGTNKPAGVGLRSSHGCIRLFPEDIAQLYDMVPVGTQVRVVNQPFVFGWHAGQLYMQPFDVLEDDTRDWKKASVKLLSKSLAASLQKQLKAHNEKVSWDLVSTLSHSPRGIAVPISGSGASVDQVLAAAQTVQNRVPDGSTWDGKTDLPMDEATFQQMISEIQPGSSGASAPAAAPSGGGSSAAPVSTGSPAKPRPAGPPVTSTAGSQFKSAE
ncbi:MAG TPA: L,D-transpeptidase family protein [Steroidobacteraceae bacterium]|nr:L,D-transpeptidase family protein [Steroidobacteraceae bacterium]